MIMVGKGTVEDIQIDDAETIEYNKVPEDESWKINMVKELIDIKHENVEVLGMDNDELDHILDHICTS